MVYTLGGQTGCFFDSETCGSTSVLDGLWCYWCSTSAPLMALRYLLRTGLELRLEGIGRKRFPSKASEMKLWPSKHAPSKRPKYFLGKHR